MEDWRSSCVTTLVLGSASRSQEFSWDLQAFHILSRLSQDNKIFVKILRIVTFCLQDIRKNPKNYKIFAAKCTKKVKIL